MHDEKAGEGTSFLVKFLMVSGLITCVVGVFIALFVSGLIGAFLIVAGLVDLTFSYFFPRLKQIGG